MNVQQYSVVAFIGRMEPPHKGHIETIKSALTYGGKVLIILGSHNSARTVKNPWTSGERIEMITSSLSQEENSNIIFATIEDNIYSDVEWFTAVSAAIREAVANNGGGNAAIIAFSKDDSTYYLNYFKNYLDILPMHEVKSGDEESPAMSSTKIRELYFEGYLNFISDVVSDGTFQFLKKFYETVEFSMIKAEYDHAIKYQKMFENVPYGNTNFLTVDSVVIQSGHVLLVKRGGYPGKGLFALPGGHLNNNERFLDGAIRELREETSLNVPEKVLRGSIFHEQIFDHPDRSLRCRINGKFGRTVTMAFGFKLDDKEELPRVRAADDACEARWVPLDVVMNDMRGMLMEDHWDIIKRFSSIL